MSLSGAYDEANVFAKILRGELPAVTVFEDDEILCFMDVFPQTRGHLLVISKTSKARNILEAEPKPLGRLIGAVQKASRAVAAALKPDGVVVTQFNGEAAGQTVYHLHFHVIPRWAGQPAGRHADKMADVEDLKATAALIAAAL